MAVSNSNMAAAYRDPTERADTDDLQQIPALLASAAAPGVSHL